VVALAGLDHHRAPVLGQLDLMGAAATTATWLHPCDDGYLRPEWVAGSWQAIRPGHAGPTRSTLQCASRRYSPR
jgi:hypothetical protein